MRRVKPLIVTLAATAAIAGGGAAIASAATSGTTSSSTSTTAPTHTTTTAPGRSNPAPSPGKGGTGHHCTNMGAGPASGSTSSAY
jgi:hypothetical protein